MMEQLILLSFIILLLVRLIECDTFLLGYLAGEGMADG